MRVADVKEAVAKHLIPVLGDVRVETHHGGRQLALVHKDTGAEWGVINFSPAIMFLPAGPHWLEVLVDAHGENPRWVFGSGESWGLIPYGGPQDPQTRFAFTDVVELEQILDQVASVI